ncbi:MAG TPA: tetratricopeptide repeat protein [Blastocatellia bacterium]|nr:tetratricopeptide repeat protein [Blastocatellia bacterium]
MKRLGLLTLILFLNCTYYSGAAQNVSAQQGRDLLKRGSYKEAITAFSALAAKDPSDRESQEGLALALFETGDYAGAEKQTSAFLSSQRDDASIRVILGDVKYETGRYADAASEYDRAAKGAKGTVWLRATLGRARALYAQGKDEEARKLLEEFPGYYRANSPTGAEDLTAIGRGLVYLERFQDANDLYIDAREADPSHAEAFVAQGELLNEKYNYGDAASLFQDALKINPNHAGAYVGLAESRRLESSSEPLKAIERALSVNPNHAGALAFKAWLELEADRPEQADASLSRALKVNPNSVEAISVRTAMHYVSGRKAEFDAEVRRALAVNPRAGRLYQTLAHFAMINRRYSESVEFGRRAVELSPRLWSARTDLGIQLLRIGRMVDGRAELERAFEGDPFNIWAKNSLDLLDSMRDYTETIQGPFIIKVAPKESGAVSAYAASLLEEAHRKLTAKYRFTPKAPISVELFPNHEDFAVRSFGLPGIGALGVCFGQVIAMDSPSARPYGEFNWGGTLWHEYAHVVTLQITDYGIPRWFSEGLSVYEERRARPGWGDNWSVPTLKAFLGGRFVKVEDMEAAFTRPTTPDGVGLAYFQASMICEFIDEKYGFDAILKLLALYKERVKTPDALQRALSVSPADFDRAFNEYLKAKVQPYVEAVANSPLEAPSGQPPSKEAIAAVLKDRPNDFFAHLRLGTIYKSEGDTDRAIEHLRRATAVFPFYGGEGNAYSQLADIYEAQGKKAEAAEMVEALIRHRETDAGSYKRLAKLKLEAGDRAGALETLFTSFYVYPFDASLHKQAGDVYLEQGKARDAAREFRVVVALGPPDLAAAHFDLARALEAMGSRAEARREVLRALEIAPGFEKAQELLLKLRGATP